MGDRMTGQPTCFHALTEESVSRRWDRVEAMTEDDRDELQWCACCCGPSKSELCTRCQELTDEQYATLMGMRAEVVL